MLTKKQISEIREHLEKAQNPIFFFDNDQDGLCSFLLLQRWLGRGKGVAVKSYPEMGKAYFRKVQELNADYIFILDKPVVGSDFWEEVSKANMPVVWIDHHEIQGQVPEFVNYYNPIYGKNKSEEPVTKICYDVVQRKEDIWLAVIGCIADSYMPKFYESFFEKYLDLGVKTEKPFEVLYTSRIGEIGKILSAGLKDKTTNVVSMLRFLIQVKTPYEVLEETSKNRSMHERFRVIEKKYKLLLNKAIEKKTSGKLLFFKYSGDLSISGELANELYYMFPEKVIVVAYVKGAKVNISARGKNVKEIILGAIKDLDATGGGHPNAVGAQIKVEDLGKFRTSIEKFIK